MLSKVVPNIVGVQSQTRKAPARRLLIQQASSLKDVTASDKIGTGAHSKTTGSKVHVVTHHKDWLSMTEGPEGWKLADYLRHPPAQEAMLDAANVVRVDQDSFQCTLGGIQALSMLIEPQLRVRVAFVSDGPKPYLKLEITEMRLGNLENADASNIQCSSTTLVHWIGNSSDPEGSLRVSCTSQIDLSLLLPDTLPIPMMPSALEATLEVVLKTAIERSVASTLSRLEKHYQRWAGLSTASATSFGQMLSAPILPQTQLPIIEQASPCPAIKSNNFTESDKDDSYVQADSFLNSIRAGISGDIPPSAESEPTTSQIQDADVPAQSVPVESTPSPSTPKARTKSVDFWTMDLDTQRSEPPSAPEPKPAQSASDVSGSQHKPPVKTVPTASPESAPRRNTNTARGAQSAQASSPANLRWCLKRKLWVPAEDAGPSGLGQETNRVWKPNPSVGRAHEESDASQQKYDSRAREAYSAASAADAESKLEGRTGAHDGTATTMPRPRQGGRQAGGEVAVPSGLVGSGGGEDSRAEGPHEIAQPSASGGASQIDADAGLAEGGAAAEVDTNLDPLAGSADSAVGDAAEPSPALEVLGPNFVAGPTSADVIATGGGVARDVRGEARPAATTSEDALENDALLAEVEKVATSNALTNNSAAQDECDWTLAVGHADMTVESAGAREERDAHPEARAVEHAPGRVCADSMEERSFGEERHITTQVGDGTTERAIDASLRENEKEEILARRSEGLSGEDALMGRNINHWDAAKQSPLDQVDDRDAASTPSAESSRSSVFPNPPRPDLTFPEEGVVKQVESLLGTQAKQVARLEVAASAEQDFPPYASVSEYGSKSSEDVQATVLPHTEQVAVDVEGEGDEAPRTVEDGVSDAAREAVVEAQGGTTDPLPNVYNAEVPRLPASDADKVRNGLPSSDSKQDAPTCCDEPSAEATTVQKKTNEEEACEEADTRDDAQPESAVENQHPTAQLTYKRESIGLEDDKLFSKSESELIGIEVIGMNDASGEGHQEGARPSVTKNALSKAPLVGDESQGSGDQAGAARATVDDGLIGPPLVEKAPSLTELLPEEHESGLEKRESGEEFEVGDSVPKVQTKEVLQGAQVAEENGGAVCETPVDKSPAAEAGPAGSESQPETMAQSEQHIEEVDRSEDAPSSASPVLNGGGESHYTTVDMPDGTQIQMKVELITMSDGTQAVKVMVMDADTDTVIEEIVTPVEASEAEVGCISEKTAGAIAPPEVVQDSEPIIPSDSAAYSKGENSIDGIQAQSTPQPSSETDIGEGVDMEVYNRAMLDMMEKLNQSEEEEASSESTFDRMYDQSILEMFGKLEGLRKGQNSDLASLKDEVSRMLKSPKRSRPDARAGTASLEEVVPNLEASAYKAEPLPSTLPNLSSVDSLAMSELDYSDAIAPPQVIELASEDASISPQTESEGLTNTPNKEEAEEEWNSVPLECAQEGFASKPSSCAEAPVHATSAISLESLNGADVDEQAQAFQERLVLWQEEVQQENAAYEKNSAFDCKFSASNELIVPVREPLIEGTRIPIGTVEEYMLDSDRLVRMIYSNNAVERITDTSWRIRLVSVSFFQLQFTPIYVLHMIASPDGKMLWVRSGTVTMDPEGLPKILETVALNMFMEGNLNVIRKPGGGVDVTAKANLKVSAQLPNWMRPLPGVQEVGDSILQGILQGVKFAANFKLEQDFLEWVKIRDNPH